MGAILAGMERLTVEWIPDEDGRGYTARVPDIPAYGEGDTKEEALADLREALAAYVEAFGLEAALSQVNQPDEIRKVEFVLDEPVGA